MAFKPSGECMRTIRTPSTAIECSIGARSAARWIVEPADRDVVERRRQCDVLVGDHPNAGTLELRHEKPMIGAKIMIAEHGELSERSVDAGEQRREPVDVRRAHRDEVAAEEQDVRLTCGAAPGRRRRATDDASWRRRGNPMQSRSGAGAARTLPARAAQTPTVTFGSAPEGRGDARQWPPSFPGGTPSPAAARACGGSAPPGGRAARGWRAFRLSSARHQGVIRASFGAVTVFSRDVTALSFRLP